MTPLKFITEQEREALNNEVIAKGSYRDQFEPGTLFYMPWLYDPINEEDAAYKKGNSSYLSQHYWKDWSNVRPPIQLVLPNGSSWVMDSTSTNGNGWSVLIENGNLPSETNRNPKITASPSILTEATEYRVGFHGWLVNGVLTEC